MTAVGRAGLYWAMGRSRVAFLVAASLLILGSHDSPAQYGSTSRYEAMYGTPVDVALSDLIQNGIAYEGRAVRTRGRVQLLGGLRDRLYTLHDIMGDVQIVPVAEIAGNFDQDVLKLMGGETRITGVFNSNSSSAIGTGQPVGVIQFWGYTGPPERGKKGLPKGAETTIESLVLSPGSRDGNLVRVVGQFRGRNLYGDLPVSSELSRSDWVIKDDVFAVWITGKKPKGSGWELDAGLKRDTGKWIAVVGRPTTRKGITYIDAERVELTTAPSPTAKAEPPPPPPEIPKVPPVIVFALPLDGETVPPDSRFTVQFSKDMKIASFKGHVALRYAGPVLPGDHPFDGVKLSYDGGRRALTVDPGDLLRRGREVELMLFPGIADIDGLALQPRSGVEAKGAVDVLHYRVGS